MAITSETAPEKKEDSGVQLTSSQFGVLRRIEIEREEVLETLTPRQRKFLENYLLNDEMRGNGTIAYAEAYGYDLDSLPNDDEVRDDEGVVIVNSTRNQAYHTCSQSASRLLRNVKIQEAKTAILNAGMTEAVVDSKMFWHILYGKGEQSMQAIKEFNRLKGRIKEKMELSGDASIQAFYAQILKRNDESMKQE